MIREAAAIALGIAGGVWLCGVARALRWAIGIRLYAYGCRLRARATRPQYIEVEE